ncbi:universal stress protein [Streptomyces sp. NPDC050504]|uniref:universal stress protein n=1 Tax=Streptomyces sp. NPDC050504 TaxID=3365618 RepID=UPI0037A49533
MTRTVTVGFDGSRESRAAAEWAAREAMLLGRPLKLIHVWEPPPGPLAQAPLLGAETHQHWKERIPREAADGLRLRHPGLDVSIEQPQSVRVAETLLAEAGEAELLVIGSRGLSGIGGFMTGSVGLSVVAHVERPVVLVRAVEQAADKHADKGKTAAAPRPVVLGLDTDHDSDELIGFAFAAAARHGACVRAVHSWSPPAYYAYGMSSALEADSSFARSKSAALTEVLRPWREKFPHVDVVKEPRYGSPSQYLVDASRSAGLLVVGRRPRRGPLGPRIGPVAHAVLHHSHSPVAIVPHS